MATVTVFTAERSQAIEDGTVVDGEIISGNLILTKHDGTQIDAGPVIGPVGPPGPTGPASISAIPGEIKMWPGAVLPEVGSYGKWDWCDGGVLVVATYPIAAGHIDPAWKTFAGASDPGAGNFRKPDMRGLVPAGLDAMPGGARANRMTRAVAITLAGRTGEEQHVIVLNEMASHNHGGGSHSHGIDAFEHSFATGGSVTRDFASTANISDAGLAKASGNIITAQGGGGAHENVQPTVFVPYIVKLDD